MNEEKPTNSRKKYKGIFFSLVAIVLGCALFVYAEIDDSPGGQLIGMVVVIGSVLNLIKKNKR